MVNDNALKICFTLISLFLFCGYTQSENIPTAPYPKSPAIENINWEFDKLTRMAFGSDLWPVTWAADDNIYTSWGDGVGFGAVDFKEQWGSDRVSLGFARIEGTPDDVKGHNVWGGKDAEKPTKFGGKCSGMISVNGKLYAWINIQNTSNFWDYQLMWSSNLGANWQKESWVFEGGRGKFFPQAFLNFGRDYAGRKDEFVYFYGRNWGTTWSDGTSLYLGRVHKEKIKDINSYQFYNGVNENRAPIWKKDIKTRKPVFSDPNGIIAASVVFNPGVGRYIMTASRRNVGQLGIFDAPEPWGPWTKVAYYDNWGDFKGYGLFYHFPTKWISSDGKTMWMIFSSSGKLDSFNLIKGSLRLNTSIPKE